MKGCLCACAMVVGVLVLFLARASVDAVVGRHCVQNRDCDADECCVRKRACFRDCEARCEKLRAVGDRCDSFDYEDGVLKRYIVDSYPYFFFVYQCPCASNLTCRRPNTLDRSTDLLCQPPLNSSSNVVLA